MFLSSSEANLRQHSSITKESDGVAKRSQAISVTRGSDRQTFLFFLARAKRVLHFRREHFTSKTLVLGIYTKDEHHLHLHLQSHLTSQSSPSPTRTLQTTSSSPKTAPFLPSLLTATPATMSDQSDFVTLISDDDYSFVITRSAACVSKVIRQMLDPNSKWQPPFPPPKQSLYSKT